MAKFTKAKYRKGSKEYNDIVAKMTYTVTKLTQYTTGGKQDGFVFISLRK